MRKHLSIITLSILLLLGTVLGQGPGTLRERYGAADEKGRYTVRPGIGLEAKYDADGNPTEMIVKLLNDGTTPDSKTPQRRNAMRRHIALEILDELIPTARRGKRTASFLEERGCFSRETTEYETVTTTIENRCEVQGGGTYSLQIHWKK